MINRKTIEEVFNTAQVEEVIREYINLKKRGANLLGLCPFHDEKTPSFTVSPAKNIYKCFGCGKGGDAVKFIMEHDQMSFPEAIRHLAGKYNITIEEDNVNKEEYQQEKQEKESLHIVNNFAKEYFEKTLWESDEGRAIGLSYFKERGFLEKTIRDFNLGFALQSRDHFVKQAIDAKFNIEFLRDLGLVNKFDTDFFNDRVMFTIHSLTGKPIAFAGRILKKNEKAPKYINSPESPIYNKSQVLYAIHLAKKAILKQDFCILVEGYTDVISLHQAGVENVVASSGTSLTSGQVRLIKRFSPNLTILYDGDGAGIKAALRGLDIALENDINVKIAILPEGQDPDSFIKEQGKTGFDEFLDKNAKDFIIFKVQHFLSEASNDPIKKANVIRDIVASIAKIKDRIKRSMYIQQCAQIMDIAESILIKETNSAIRNNIKTQNKRKSFQNGQPSVHEESFISEPKDIEGIHQQKQIVLKDEVLEKDLVRIIILFGYKVMENQEVSISVVNYIYSSIETLLPYFDNVFYSELIEEAFHIDQKGELNDQYFIRHENDKVKELASDFALSPYEFASWNDYGVFLQTQKMPDLNFEADTEQAVQRITMRKLTKIIKKLEEKIQVISSAENQEDLPHLLTLFKQFKTQQNEIANEFGNAISWWHK